MAVCNRLHINSILKLFVDFFFLFCQSVEIDATQKSGASPESVAEDIYRALLSDEKDIVLAPIQHIAVQWLRLICPSIYFWAMEKQARKTKPNIE